MLAPLVECVDKILPNANVFFEVPCTAGVPDLVLVDLDHGAIEARARTAPLIDHSDLRVLLSLSSGDPVSGTLGYIADAVSLSAQHLKRVVLPRLVDGGHLTTGDGHWRSAYQWDSLARRVVTIEVKRSDWRQGLAQATRHTSVADEAWLVLDEQTSNAARAHEHWFETYDVGLALLSLDGEMSKVRVPRNNRSRRPQRELLVERAVDLYLKGHVSGPIPRVFGEVLTSTTGDDPRLKDASAH